MAGDAVVFDPTIRRAEAKEYEDGCSFCTDEENGDRNSKEMLLSVENETEWLIFCAYHEGVLLMRLLNNYHRRKRRGRNSSTHGGFLEDIPKEDLCELCGDIIIADIEDARYAEDENYIDVEHADINVDCEGKITIQQREEEE